VNVERARVEPEQLDPIVAKANAARTEPVAYQINAGSKCVNACEPSQMPDTTAGAAPAPAVNALRFNSFITICLVP